jgi:hypothetical protein
MTEPLWAATVLLVWVPLAAAFVLLGTSLLAQRVGNVPARGLQVFAIALLATTAWLVHVHPPRILRLAAIPAIPAATAAWLLL